MPLSKHEKVYSHLKNEILEGYYDAGDQLPSEKRLCDYFDVSRVTVRRALQDLENEGFIEKKQGLGAFVSKLDLSRNLVQLTDFSQDMRRAGLESSSSLIGINTVSPIPEINNILQLHNDMKLIQIERVRLANERPVALDITWLPPSYGQLLFDEDLTHQTIYEIFEKTYDIPIIAGRYRITASVASEEQAQHLQMEEGAALLEIDRCSRTFGNKKIYYQKRYYNPSLVTYEMELARDEETNFASGDGLPLKEFIPSFSETSKLTSNDGEI